MINRRCGVFEKQTDRFDTLNECMIGDDTKSLLPKVVDFDPHLVQGQIQPWTLEFLIGNYILS